MHGTVGYRFLIMLVGCLNVLFGTKGHQHGFLRLRSVEKVHVRSFAEIGKTIKARN